MIKMLISKEEKSLLSDTRDVAYGEIYEVAIVKGSAIVREDVTSKEASLIQAVRGYGLLEKIVIHDNEPVSADVMTKTQNGRRCLKKIRF